MIEQVLFYLFSGIAIVSAWCVVTHPNMTRSLLSLIVTMFSLTVLYLLLGAPFVAMVNLIVYAGAVLVLFLFVIMMQGVGAKDTPLKERFPKIHLILGLTVGGLFFFMLLSVIKKGAGSLQAEKIYGSVQAIGERLFFGYLLPFELISILLLLGVFSAVALAKKDEGEA